MKVSEEQRWPRLHNSSSESDSSRGECYGALWLYIHSVCCKVQVFNGYFSLVARLENRGEGCVRSASYPEKVMVWRNFIFLFNGKGLLLVLGSDWCLPSAN